MMHGETNARKFLEIRMFFATDALYSIPFTWDDRAYGTRTCSRSLTCVINSLTYFYSLTLVRCMHKAVVHD